MVQTQIRDILASNELFQSLSKDELDQLIHSSKPVSFPEGAHIIQEGEKAESLYAVMQGQVRLFHISEIGMEVDIHRLTPGESFGGIELVDGEVRTTSCTALEPVQLLEIPKSQFQSVLQSHPELYSRLLRIVHSWLQESSRRASTAIAKEQSSTHLLSESFQSSYPELIGRGQKIKQTMNRATSMAGSDCPCFILGEEGTEVLGVAFYIHKHSWRNNGPLLRFQAQKVGQLTSWSSPEERLAGEDRQLQVLFGALTAPGSPALGLLPMAEHGTLVIEGLESLAIRVQNQLADFLTTGHFHFFQSMAGMSSSVRIIGTCQLPPTTLVNKGLLSTRLYALFDPDPVKIPPLRKRKNDLMLIAEHLIHRANRVTGKAVQEMDTEVSQRIMAHDWPGNYEELKGVLTRGVRLAQGNILTSQDLFIGIDPVVGKNKFDLLQLQGIKKFLQSTWYPWRFQYMTTGLLVAIVFLAFWGQSPGQSLALDVTWGLWEPMVLMGAIFIGRAWCAICPISGAGLYLNRRAGLNFNPPQFLRQNGAYVRAAGVAVIIWAEMTWNLFSWAQGTAILLVILACMGLFTSLIYQKLTWCKYVCPLGALLGLFARCSCTEIRSNRGVCANVCQEHTCIDRSSDASCPMLEAPFAIQSNQDCILCGQCVKYCPEDAPQFNLRIPGHELGKVQYPSSVMTVLVPVVLGTQIFRGLFNLDVLAHLNTTPIGWVYMLAGLGCCILLATGCIKASSSLLFGNLSEPELKESWFLNYALVPLLFAYELGFHLKMFLTQGGWIVPELGTIISVEWSNPLFVFTPSALVAVQTILICIGTLWTLALANHIAENHADSEGGLTLQRRWVIVFLGLVSLMCLIIQ